MFHVTVSLFIWIIKCVHCTLLLRRRRTRDVTWKLCDDTPYMYLLQTIVNETTQKSSDLIDLTDLYIGLIE